MAGGNTQRSDATFERRNLLLQRIIGRVHDAGVDVPEFLERKHVRRMLRIVEHVTRRLIDRRDPRIGRRVRLAASMNGESFGAKVSHQAVLS